MNFTQISTVIYFIFFIIIPVISIIFRIRKKINTNFLMFTLLTSFLLGMLIGGTFVIAPHEQLVEYLNNNELKKAKTELKRILQSSPDYLKNIESGMLRNPENFIKIKQEAEKEYLTIAEKYLTDNNNYSIDIYANCGRLKQEEEKLAKLKNAERILSFAELIGENQSRNREYLRNKIESGNLIIAEMMKKCGSSKSE